MYFEAEKLSVGYDGKPIVSDINVELRKGQILSIIGPNGSGKSTFLKSITKQLRLISGRVTELTPEAAAVVLTERPRPELMTCFDVVAVGRYPYTGRLGILSETDRAKIDDALRTVNALELKDRDFNRISDGQLQRIMLARAICQEPEIIVLDEPTSFLDIRYAIEILDILRKMADERGLTVIMSLHELSYAKRVSDLVMCVKDGRIMALDRPENVFDESIISRLYDLPPGIFAELFGGL